MPVSVDGGGGDAEDVLEALIQHELAKFQQQQAAHYSELLACGQPVVLPLASPAPQQQLLRSQQKPQEAVLSGVCLQDCADAGAAGSACCFKVSSKQMHAAGLFCTSMLNK